MGSKETKIYFENSADADILRDHIVAIIGYCNQGRAQALNLSDSRVQVIVGNRKDEYRTRAIGDGFYLS